MPVSSSELQLPVACIDRVMPVPRMRPGPLAVGLSRMNLALFELGASDLMSRLLIVKDIYHETGSH